MGIQSFDSRVARWSIITYVLADGASFKPLFTAGPYGSLLLAVLASNDAVAAHVVDLLPTVATFVGPLASLSVPSGAGAGGVPPPDMLAVAPWTTLGGVQVPPNQVVNAFLEVAMLAGTTLRLTAVILDF